VQLHDLQAKATTGVKELANTSKSTLHWLFIIFTVSITGLKNNVIIYELDNIAKLHLL